MDRYKCFSKLPTHYFKKASKEVFFGLRAPSAIKGRWERLLKTYKYILAFDGYTENGGADGDDDDGDPDPSDKRVLKRRLDGAHGAGHAVGNLSVQIVQD
ncbi:hypothetical protein JB92DRAFT_3118325 [Gautieria morchelliformis]|nr:hypothetical protein JB92DRAFT_3118325 [Gautieria morchelliformis]